MKRLQTILALIIVIGATGWATMQIAQNPILQTGDKTLIILAALALTLMFTIIVAIMVMKDAARSVRGSTRVLPDEPPAPPRQLARPGEDRRQLPPVQYRPEADEYEYYEERRAIRVENEALRREIAEQRQFNRQALKVVDRQNERAYQNQQNERQMLYSLVNNLLERVADRYDLAQPTVKHIYGLVKSGTHSYQDKATGDRFIWKSGWPEVQYEDEMNEGEMDAFIEMETEVAADGRLIAAPVAKGRG